MIVVDTSALLSILQDEADANDIAEVLKAEAQILMSAATLAEALIVAGRRNSGREMAELIGRLKIDIVPVSPLSATRVAEAYRRWGKGIHPARLNFGDCFAYELADANACPLLFIGNDFAQTDIAAALPA